MNIEHTRIAWLTREEVERAIRAFVRAEGTDVPQFASVGGLEGLSEAKNAVSVQLFPGR